MSSISVALTRGRHADGAKHTAYVWVFYVEGEGMYCKLCRKFDTIVQELVQFLAQQIEDAQLKAGG